VTENGLKLLMLVIIVTAVIVWGALNGFPTP
jgi:hypothetical protein